MKGHGAAAVTLGLAWPAAQCLNCAQDDPARILKCNLHNVIGIIHPVRSNATIPDVLGRGKVKVGGLVILQGTFECPITLTSKNEVAEGRRAT
jgi:hypothetical protein